MPRQFAPVQGCAGLGRRSVLPRPTARTAKKPGQNSKSPNLCDLCDLCVGYFVLLRRESPTLASVIPNPTYGPDQFAPAQGCAGLGGEACARLTARTDKKPWSKPKSVNLGDLCDLCVKFSFLPQLGTQIRPSFILPASLIMCWFHGGSQTNSTSASSTPGMVRILDLAS
jgi:hypothetical protein